MLTFAYALGCRPALVVRRSECAIRCILRCRGGDGWRTRCERRVGIVFIVELQYLRCLAAAKPRCKHQTEINSSGHPTSRYAIAIGNHTFFDGSCTKHREKIAKPPMTRGPITRHESGCAENQ